MIKFFCIIKFLVHYSMSSCIGQQKGNEMKKDYNKQSKNNRNLQKQTYKNNEERTYDDQVEGRNSVLELLESGCTIPFIARYRKTWIY